jgi:redox-sensitive bicupin YhaK (pirin superfamily)
VDALEHALKVASAHVKDTLTRARRIATTITTAPAAPGFMGAGHEAVAVVSPGAFAMSDPFILLMDDRMDLGDRPAGGPHPHAGFETVTLVIEGTIRDRDEGLLHAGDAVWMTAGRGIIHNEDVRILGRTRVLQLWLTLPKRDRWTAPGFQEIRLASLPVRRDNGAEVRLYSGRSGPEQSPTRNHVPVTLADITLASGAVIEQDLPASYHGFVYVLDGSAAVGDGTVVLTKGQVGWLDRPQEDLPGSLRVLGGTDGARLVLYAGEPQGDAIVASGPFIADTEADIRRLFADYRAGRFVRMSELSRA